MMALPIFPVAFSREHGMDSIPVGYHGSGVSFLPEDTHAND